MTPTRRRVLAAGALALVSGGAVLIVTSTIDPVYQARAAAKVRLITGDDDLLGVMRIRERDFRVRTSPRAPYLPEARHALNRIATASGVELDDVEVAATGGQSVFASLGDPTRLTVVVKRSDPRRAARDANAFLEHFIAYRDRWYARELGAVRRYLRRKLRLRRAGGRVFPSGPQNPAEGLDAAAILLRVERKTLTPERPARVPSDPIAPSRARDTLVAAIIGALVGWLVAGAWPPRTWLRLRDRRRRGRGTAPPAWGGSPR